MTKELEALKKRIEEVAEEDLKKLTQIIDHMIIDKKLCLEGGYNLQAFRLAERLARESGDTEDYWGDYYDEALAQVELYNQL